MKLSKEADWYNDYYRNIQMPMGPWHRFLLPELRKSVTRNSRLLELGCGLGQILRWLVQEQLIPEEQIYAIEQSETAIEFVRKFLPQAQLATGDLFQLNFSNDFFDFCLLLETIEHLEAPVPAVQRIYQVLKPGGILFLSFPNFLHLPWLLVRILAEKLNRPNWIVLQPIDRIYTVFGVIRLVEQAGFKFERGIGSNYGPPVLYRLEKDWTTKCLNGLKLWRFSFHPILLFRKPVVGGGSMQRA